MSNPLPFIFQDLKFWPGSYYSDSSVFSKLTTHTSYEPISSLNDDAPLNPSASHYQHYCYQKRRKSAISHTVSAASKEDSLLSPIQSTKSKWLTSLQNINVDVDGDGGGGGGGMFSRDHQPIAGSNFDLPEDACNQKYTLNWFDSSIFHDYDYDLQRRVEHFLYSNSNFAFS